MSSPTRDMPPARLRTAKPVLRLRPAVSASPATDGIHVRGWAGAFDAGGGADMWRLWLRLEPVLRRGVAEDQLYAALSHRRTRAAVQRLVRALREHGMVLAVPGEPAGTGTTTWLEQLSHDPARAWQRIAHSSVTVTGSGPVAAAAVAALEATGIPVTVGRVGTRHDSTIVVLRGHDGVAVAACADNAGGFVTAPRMTRAATRIRSRLSLAETRSVPAPLAALVGGAAAQRLACHLADLPDPSRSSGKPWPMVLVARSTPLSTAYHPWLPGAASEDSPDDLDDALRRLDVLCDGELGVLVPPRSDDIPQVPVPLAACLTGHHLAVGTGFTTGAARLDVALRAAQRRLEPTGSGRLAVGTDTLHADGILLRRAALDTVRQWPQATGEDQQDPRAQRWWTTLTVRFGVPARCVTVRLADGVSAAVVTAAGRELARAVESTPGAAATYALLQATAAQQARRTGIAADHGPMTLCGAALPPPEGATWAAGAWNGPDTRGAEELFQQSLRRVVPVSRHPGPCPKPLAGELYDALGVAGFVIRVQGGRDG